MEKTALIELTDNKAILSIYQTKGGRYKLIRQESDAIAISSDILQEKLLRPKTISDTVGILKLYRQVIEEHEVQKITAIADSLILQARNQRGFFEEIYNNTGMGFIFLSDEEFVKTLYNATAQKIDSSKGSIIHVGAYNTFVIKFNRRTTVGFEKFNIGYENITGSTFEEIKANAKNVIKIKSLNFEEDEVFIGAGAPFLNLGRVAKKVEHYSLELDNNYPVSSSLAKKTTDFVASLDMEKIKKVKGLVDDRAEVLISGLAIVSAIYDNLSAKDIIITSAALRDGIIAGSIASDVQERFSDLLGASYDSIAQFNKEDSSVNLRVANMAGILFKQLKVMHKLPRSYVKPMRVAAYMFNSGKAISFDEHEKHSFYTILNSGLAGVTHKELLLGAFICVNQVSDNFNLTQWMKYKDMLTDEDLNAVRKLGVIVKLAVALNSGKKLVVTDVVCDILGDSIIMKTIVNSDPVYEIMQGMKVAKDYRKFFKKNLQLI